MNMKNEIKQFLQTSAARPVEADLEKRILRGAVLATTGMASDGWIILPSGIDLARFLSAPIITARHIAGMDSTASAAGKPLVIANAISVSPSSTELVAEIQFADTQDGRDFAYLYGVNPARQAFMRAWSVEGPVLERQAATWAQAKAIAGQYWDTTLAARFEAKKATTISVAMRFELACVAAVALGADRNALTRACQDGVRLAGELVARMDLQAAGAELAAMKEQLTETDARMARLESEIQVLRGEGASAAAQRNSEALLNAVRSLRSMIDNKG